MDPTVNPVSLLGDTLYLTSTLQSDWNQTDSAASDFIKNKPAVGGNQVNADWNAVSGAAQILNKPTIPAAQIQSDWNQSTNTALDFIKNKPTIPGAQIQSDWNQITNTALDFIKNKPTIPAAQIQSDWNQSTNTALDFIKNKPTIPNLTTAASFGTSSTAAVSVGVSGQSLTLQGVQNPITVGGALSDETTTLTTNNKLTIRMPFAFTIRSGALPYWWVNTLPTATTPITFDILKNGASIYSSKPTLSSTATNNASQNGTLTSNPTTFAAGDLLVAQVSVVGSGTPNGAKIVIFNS